MSEYSQKTKTLKFAADCTIYEVADHYQRIVEAINKAPVVKLDFSDVKNVDSSFLQLLVCAQLEAKRNETKLEIKGDSDMVNDLATHIYCQASLTGADNVTASGE